MNLPYRYDLPNSTAVNRVITTLNRKLKKIIKAHPHTYFMEMDNTRILFTNHGLHMNNLGKQLVNCHIVTLVYSILEQKKPSPISLGWYEPQNCNNPTHVDNQIISVTRNSSRNKKLPVTRSDDFLWQA
jgi:N-glycosylase/DNA lyase